MRAAKSLLVAAGMAALVTFAAPAVRAQQSSHQQDAVQAQQTSQSAADAQNSQQNPADFDAFSDPAMAAAATRKVDKISPADVLKLLKGNDQQYELVDTQPVEGYADGHIPGAVNYPWVMRITKFPIALPRDKMLVFYGSCPNDTNDIVKQLAEFGYFNVKIMDGGWYKWLELKYPAEGPISTPTPPAQVSQLTNRGKDARQ
jgi:rhodanese-related sulfurtransferase